MSQRTDPFQTGPLALDHREDWSTRFGREAPLEVEVGFGYGHFLLAYAARHPDRNLVGIEFRKKLAEGAATKIAREGLPNALALHGDARRMLPTLFAPGSVAAFHVQFPDPWWKKRHHKRRLVDEDLARAMHHLLAAEGVVWLRTDILDYARAMIETFEDGSGRWVNRAGPGTFLDHDPLGVPSNRERRYLATGTPVYRLAYDRRDPLQK